MIEIIWFNVFLLFLIFCSGYCSASETALFSLTSTKLKAYQTGSNPRRRLIAKLLSEPRDLLVTVFMLNTLVNILIQNNFSSLFGETASWILKIGVPFAVMLIIGEIIPKYMGLQNNIAIADAVAPSVNWLQNILKPIRALTIAITDPISRLLFFYLHKEPSISIDELRHVLKTSEEGGILHKDEAELICGYLDLQNSITKQLMHPREDILFYDINEPLSKLIHLCVDQQRTRVPVCDKSIDNMLGIINANKLFLLRKHLKTSNDLLKHLSKPLYVPENTSAAMLRKTLESQEETLALAVDEYGSVSGLITLEDLIEEVIGEIADSRDAKHLYMKAGTHAIIASGRLELSEFNELFKVEFKSENNLLTVGGWLVEYLQEIPKSGTQFEINGFLFQVLAADPNKIRRLYISKLNGNARKILIKNKAMP